MVQNYISIMELGCFNKMDMIKVGNCFGISSGSEERCCIWLRYPVMKAYPCTAEIRAKFDGIGEK